MNKSMGALDLPERFFLVGHSMGGYLASLYASQNPRRIKALFCISSAGMETYDPQNYHPERYPDFDEPTKYLSSKLVKASLNREEQKNHPFAILLKLNPEVRASVIDNNVRTQICREDVPHPITEE